MLLDDNEMHQKIMETISKCATLLREDLLVGDSDYDSTTMLMFYSYFNAGYALGLEMTKEEPTTADDELHILFGGSKMAIKLLRDNKMLQKTMMKTGYRPVKLK